MATYYRWNKSSVEPYESSSYETYPSLSFSGVYWYANGKINPSGTIYTLPNSAPMPTGSSSVNTNGMSISPTQTTTVLYVGQMGSTLASYGLAGGFTKYQMVQIKGTFIGYVYSTNPSTYPDGGISGSYYYDQRTEIGNLVLSVPQMVMQGQQATISWTAVDGADSYTLQRKSSADADWTQVYSGTDLSYTETVGTWTSLQYRVCAVFGDTPGGWATSGEIQIVSASALVISGSDGDLGTLTNDVQYVVSSSGSGAIAVTESIGGQEVRTFTAENGGTNKISVLDLPTGSGVTIKITASTNPGSGTVSVTRTWTYSKESPIFSDSGGTAQLQWQGQDIWPLSLAECVRTPDFWGGNLMLALQKLTDAVLYKGGNNFSDIFNKSIPLVTSSQISSYGKIQTGTYTGTGAYGSKNPTSLTFNFTPKLVLIFDTTGLFSQPQNGQTYYVSYGMILWAPGISKDIVSSYPDKYRYYTLTGNKFSWYADGPNYQLNDKKTYRWVAFG